MKVAFITEHAPSDVSAFSGVPHFMLAALRRTFGIVHTIQTLPYSYELVTSDPVRGLEQLRKIGLDATEQLRPLDYDFVLCQGAAAIPFLETDRPVALWHDSLFSALMRLPFAEFRQKHPLLYDWDRMTLEKISVAAFAAEWMIDHAVANYGAPRGKCMLLPFGANLSLPDAESVLRSIVSRDRSSCRLTFLGVDWTRKGLHLAYDVMRGLERMGIDATLDLIGCSLPRLSAAERVERSLRLMFQGGPEESVGVTLPYDKRVRQAGFLRKDQPADVERLESILSRSHFLLHPASFECFGIALVEANAFGVPVITTAQYGPDTIVQSGVNGYKYPAGRFVKMAVTDIAAIWRDNDRYARLAESSYAESVWRLNWLNSAAQLKDRMALLLGRRSAASAELSVLPLLDRQSA